MSTVPHVFRALEPAVRSRPAAPSWRAYRLTLDSRSGELPLRLVRFGERWLASASGLDGPTLGCSASPYLAASAALEPLGFGLAEAMRLIGRLPVDTDDSRAQRDTKRDPAGSAAGRVSWPMAGGD